MTKNQNSWNTTGCSIRDFGAANAATVNQLVNGNSNMTLLGTTLSSIQLENETQKMKKTGYASTMRSLRAKLITEAMDTLRKLITFAKFTKNLVLLEELKNAKKKIMKCTKADLCGFAQLIYDRSQANLAALATYNITAATQTLLLNTITPFAAILGKTGMGISETSQSTQRMKALFVSLISTIMALDDAVETVRSSKVDFYNGYQAVRKVRRNAGQKSMLKGIVVDENGNELEDIFVMLYLLGADGLPLKTKGNFFKKQTGKKGGFMLQAVPDGNYLGVFTNLDFEEKQVNFTRPKR